MQWQVVPRLGGRHAEDTLQTPGVLLLHVPTTSLPPISHASGRQFDPCEKNEKQIKLQNIKQLQKQ